MRAVQIFAFCTVVGAGCHTYMDFHRTSGGTICVPGSVVDCYSGPEGTAGVGTCRTGTQVCDEDGSAYGECLNEKTPEPENCATPIDDNCDGIAPACTGSVLWAKALGDASTQAASTVAVDSGDNIIVGGSFEGTLDFGGSTLMALSSFDRFVAKLDRDGNHIWSTRFGSNASVAPITLMVDSADDVIIAGTFHESSNFGCGDIVATDGYDAFVAKLDQDGSCIWSAAFGGDGSQGITSVAVDTGDHITITGIFGGSISFADTTLITMGTTNTFVARLDPSGMPLWARRFGDGGVTFARSVDTDTAGNVILTGDFTDGVDFGGGLLTSNGSDDVFLAKLDNGGGHVWDMQFGDAAQQIGWTLCVNNEDRVVLAGWFKGGIDFGGQVFSSFGEMDVFVAKLEQSGMSTWSRQFGDALAQNPYGVSCDTLGSAAVTGDFAGTIDMGTGPLASAGDIDIFLGKLDEDGGVQWAKRFGGPGEQHAAAIATDSAGNVVVVGHFAESMDFATPPQSSAGALDLFVIKLAP